MSHLIIRSTLVQRAFGFACVALTCTFVRAEQYTAQILNPIGASTSIAWGGYDGRQIGQAGGSSIQTAALWSGTPASAIPLGPPGSNVSFGLGIGPDQQVGLAAGSFTGFAYHAMLWTGSASSYVDLNPAGHDASAAYATDGFYQAGQAAAGGIIHATLWSGTAASAIDLNPAGYDSSHAYGAWNGRQVGLGSIGGFDHALLWSGTAASVVDLNGAFDNAEGYAMYGDFQVGSGSSAATGGNSHAIIWNGTAASAIDLNPAGFTVTVADGVGQGVVAGYGSGPATGELTHALVWVNGRVTDLHPFLPTGYRTSVAYGMDPVTGQVVGEATNTLNRTIAFMWSPAPCPADLNSDHTINTADLTILLGHFGLPVPTGTSGDINRDGTVNTADLLILLGAFGTACP